MTDLTPTTNRRKTEVTSSLFPNEMITTGSSKTRQLTGQNVKKVAQQAITSTMYNRTVTKSKAIQEGQLSVSGGRMCHHSVHPNINSEHEIRYKSSEILTDKKATQYPIIMRFSTSGAEMNVFWLYPHKL